VIEKPPALRRLHEARVAEDQIDHLGHMNVRFYHERALEASQALASLHGLSTSALEELDGMLEVRDAFTRHYREQLVDAPLAVQGGVLAVRPDALRLYHELVNSERDERSATFVHEVALRERATGRSFPLPEPVAKSAGNELVTLPEHGRPRTLDLDRAPDALTLAVARQRGLAMRHERVIAAEECDGQGRFLGPRYLELVWGGEPVAARGPEAALVEMGEGGALGWATLESRAVLCELPRAGTRIQSFGAEVALERKTSCRHHWVFDTGSGRLLCMHSVVNLAFDIPRRRAVEIPDHIRAALESQYHPDLR
jgi:acyl-CoA thioester hydrolase